MKSSLEQLYQRRGDSPNRENDARDPWDRDFARIVHCPAFRRLQAKTQVLGLGDSDFYRTRLTHSMEVAQIGTSIVKQLHKNKENVLFNKKLLPPLPMIGAIGLAHDLGHPPFGHGGEVALNYCMQKHGGFEGNAQTLRILSKLEKYSKTFGLNPTRRLLLGILKYPAKYSTLINKNFKQKKSDTKKVPHWIFKKDDYKPPKCFYDEDLDVVDWILSFLSDEDKKIFTEAEIKKDKHSKPKYKSFDTSIMEIADDISYSVHDLEDAISLNLIDLEKFNDYKYKNDIENYFKEFGIENNLFSKDQCKRKETIGSLIHLFITKCKIVDLNEIKNTNFTNNFIRHNVEIQCYYEEFRCQLFNLVKTYVINSPNVQIMEFKGQQIVVSLFDVISSDPERFLPQDTKELYIKSPDQMKFRVICDYISGMTDEYATKLYEKMFSTRKGSVFDHL